MATSITTLGALEAVLNGRSIKARFANGRWIAQCDDDKGAITTGSTLEEALLRMVGSLTRIDAWEVIMKAKLAGHNGQARE